MWAALAAVLVVPLAACSVGGSPPGARVSTLPTATPAGAYQAQPAAHPAARLTIGTWQFPTSFSPYLSPQASATQVQQALFDGLLETDPKLQWFGDLAREVPTIENGEVTRVGTGMDVTYNLRPGLRWSDGRPLTSNDVIFTFRVITGPAAATGFPQDGYDLISGIEPRGDTGLVAHFRALYPAYRALFPSILPEHRLGQVPLDRLAGDPYWKQPDAVSGPFTLRDAAQDQLTLLRNPSYAQGRSGMPFLGHPSYTQRIVFRGFPTRQALLAAAKAGDIDATSDLSERELATIAGLSGVRVMLAPGLQYEQVSFNQSPVDPVTGAAPPWAGEPAVLQALDLGLDRPRLERGPLHGRSPLTATPVSPLLDWAFASDLGAPRYDPAQAKRLLDAAGWIPGADGVRTKGGRRLAFALTSTSDQALRVDEEEILAQGWRQLGADVKFQNFPSQQLFGGFDQNGVLAHGLYEAAIWAWIMPADPDSEFGTLHSSRAPAAGRAASQNYSRCHDRAVDQALDQGRATLDQLHRGTAYRDFQHAYAQARCELPLYRRLSIAVVSPSLHNFVLNAGPAGSTWNLADWWMAG
jgi:peptide/nickel transport system substrate-binding protein